MLDILEGTGRVVEQATQVSIDRQKVEQLCDQWARDEFPVSPWNAQVHWSDGTRRTANAVLLLDALNFCFWPDPGQPKWSIEYQGHTLNGYMALAAGLKRAIEQGDPLYDAERLVGLTLDDLRHIFRGQQEIPMLSERQSNAQEIGWELLQSWEGSFANMVEEAAGSAPRLAQLVYDQFPCFQDSTTYRGQPVHFLKRAQITVVDLLGTFGGQGLGRFDDADQLTAFADYKIPQVLEALGVLRYSDELAATLDAKELIPAGDPREVEIRAGMVWAVEYLRRGLAERGRQVSAYELDWYLWNVGQRPVERERPYHRTRTIFY